MLRRKFVRIPQHVCTLNATSSTDLSKKWYQKFVAWFMEQFLVSENDPRVIQYFKTKSGLREEKIRQNTLVIHPFSRIKHIQEAVMTLVIFLTINMQFYTIGCAMEKNQADYGTVVYLMTYINFFNILDVFLNFFMGYVDEQRNYIELRRRKIAKKYFTTTFFFDLVSSLPTDFLAYEEFNVSLSPRRRTFWKSLHHLRLLKIFKICRFHVYFNRTCALINVKRRRSISIELVALFALIVSAISSIYMAIAFVGFRFFGRGWRTWEGAGRDFASKTPPQKMAMIAFRACGTLLGAYVPDYGISIEEGCFNIVVAFIGEIVTCFIIVIMVEHVLEKFRMETNFQSIMNQLDEYMKNKKLPIMTRERLVQYYHYKFQGKYFKEKIVTAVLSDALKKEINIDSRRRLFRNVDIFDELPAKVLADLLGHLKPEIYLPNDVIVRSGTVANCMYFLATGTVAIYTPSGKEVCHLRDGAYFGEIAIILKDTKRTADVMAIEICEVYRLSKVAFRQCFRYANFVFEQMQQIAEARRRMSQRIEEEYQLELFHKTYVTGRTSTGLRSSILDFKCDI